MQSDTYLRIIYKKSPTSGGAIQEFLTSNTHFSICLLFALVHSFDEIRRTPNLVGQLVTVDCRQAPYYCGHVVGQSPNRPAWLELTRTQLTLGTGERTHESSNDKGGGRNEPIKSPRAFHETLRGTLLHCIPCI